jgi:hypothetical protein
MAYMNPSTNLYMKHINVQTLHSNHALPRLKRALQIFKLIMAPADKGGIMTIAPEEIYKDEIVLQLSDTDTYEEITSSQYALYNMQEIHLVKEAMITYKLLNLLPRIHRDRRIYLLPKVHKPKEEWRSELTPKMRPIISDAGSVTHLLAKFLLQTLQKLEKLFTSMATSSLAVAYSIQQVNEKPRLHSNILMATIDVESLYTRIPLDPLITIIGNLLTTFSPPDFDTSTFLYYLSSLVRHNIFRVNDTFYIQKIGLPMGAPMSGTLANIYLAYLESQIINNPNILLYKRYVDDILIFSTFTEEDFSIFIQQFRDALGLNVTATSNRQSVNFLDMNIHFDPVTREFLINPYSKKPLIYPYPSLLFKRKLADDFRIICSQILRTYRLCTNPYSFSFNINSYLESLELNKYHRQLRLLLEKFLYPIKIQPNLWTTKIPICSSCCEKLRFTRSSLLKIMPLECKYLSIGSLMNCKTPNIHLAIANTNVELILVESLHKLIQSGDLKEFSNLLPIGPLTFSKLKRILKIHDTLHYANRKYVLQKKYIPPCRIHAIYNKPYYFLGIPTNPRRNKKVNNYFNKYKLLSSSTSS